MRTSEIYMTDGEVRQEVLREMRCDSRLSGATVAVEVCEGEVTLRGTVADASEMLAAIEAAGRAEGALQVRSELRVGPDGGTLSLSGRLHTWGEKKAVLGALTHAPGVQRVDDRLSLEPYF